MANTTARTLQVLALTLVGLTVLPTKARTADDPKTTNLALRLKPDSIVNGVPQAFEFELVNTTDHDVRVPPPAIQCEDSFDGTIYLQLRFRASKPDDSPPMGGGCAGDRFGQWPAIMDRAESWKVLHGGESLRMKAKSTALFYVDSGPGTYDFWATYKPPPIEEVDQQLLLGSGIDFPRVPLTSQHLVFKTQP